jgi:hypothetical protein
MSMFGYWCNLLSLTVTELCLGSMLRLGILYLMLLPLQLFECIREHMQVRGVESAFRCVVVVFLKHDRTPDVGVITGVTKIFHFKINY